MSEQAWITINVEPFELVALVDWHLERKREDADKEEYAGAEYHRTRAMELMKIREAAGIARSQSNPKVDEGR